MTERNRGTVRRSLQAAAALILAVGCVVRVGGLPGEGQAQAADPQAKPAPVPIAVPAQAAPAQAVPIPIAQFAQINRGRQISTTETSDDTLEGVFGPPDRETLKHLDRAKQLSQDGRYSESLQLLDDILESSQDYFFRPRGLVIAARAEGRARRLISSQPPEGLKAYELLFGAKPHACWTRAKGGVLLPWRKSQGATSIRRPGIRPRCYWAATAWTITSRWRPDCAFSDCRKRKPPPSGSSPRCRSCWPWPGPEVG